AVALDHRYDTGGRDGIPADHVRPVRPARRRGRSGPGQALARGARRPWRGHRAAALRAAQPAVLAVLEPDGLPSAVDRMGGAAVLGVVAGVGLLGSSAGAEGAAQVGAMFKLALIVAIAGLAVLGLAAAKLNEPYRTTALGVTAGFGYGVLSIAARVLTGFSPLELARDPAAYAVAAAGIISFMFYATALESGSVTVATAAVVLAET